MSNTSNLPYYQTLRSFEKNNEILHRENIYGNRPLRLFISEESYQNFMNYAGMVYWSLVQRIINQRSK